MDAVIRTVTLSKEAIKGLRSAPPQAVRKLQARVFWVETKGIDEARMVRGFACVEEVHAHKY